MQIIKRLTNGEVENFEDWELTKNRPVPLHLIENILPTILFVQNIRTVIGVAIGVGSGYRDYLANLEAGGDEDSLHLEFNGLDFTPKGYSAADLQQLCARIENGEFNITVMWKRKLVTITPELLGLGLNKAKGFIHIDTRGLLGRKAPSRWGY